MNVSMICAIFGIDTWFYKLLYSMMQGILKLCDTVYEVVLTLCGMKKNTIVTIASVAGSLLSVGATILSNYVSEQKLDDKVEKKVAEALKLLAESKPEE